MATKAFMEGWTADILCDDPFDSIDDLLNFPNDDDVLAMVDACGDGPPFAPPPAPTMNCSGSGGGIAEGLHSRPAAAAAGGGINSEVDALGMCSDMDITNLEWLSNFFEDSEFNIDFPATTGPITTNNEEDSLFRSSSPISVLEPTILIGGASTAAGCGDSSSTTTCSSSSSTSIGSNILIIPARARTKRPRPPSFSARSFLTPPSSEHSAPPAESAGESCPLLMKRRRKEKVVLMMGNSVPQAAAPVMQMRKCTHCQIHRTPQWRAGPMGPKTLCNACGVRYKSGRLFPEYRPAASPTFLPSIHSNSHRKVVEMRLRATLMPAGDNGGVPPMERTEAAGKSCDLLEYIRWRD